VVSRSIYETETPMRYSPGIWSSKHAVKSYKCTMSDCNYWITKGFDSRLADKRSHSRFFYNVQSCICFHCQLSSSWINSAHFLQEKERYCCTYLDDDEITSVYRQAAREKDIKRAKVTKTHFLFFVFLLLLREKRALYQFHNNKILTRSVLFACVMTLFLNKV
jgi:hypothetical protein